jgi:hypothetical protein
VILIQRLIHKIQDVLQSFLYYPKWWNLGQLVAPSTPRAMSGMEDGKSKKEWQEFGSITIAQRMVKKE